MRAKKKPLIVNVWQLPDPELEELRGSFKGMPCLDKEKIRYNPETQDYSIKSLEGVMTANIGDYVVSGGHNDIWSVKKEIFEDTYDFVSEDDDKALEEHIAAISEERQEIIDELIYMIVELDPGSSISTYFNFRGNGYHVKISELPEDKDDEYKTDIPTLKL